MDLSKGSKGDLVGTFGNPAEKVRGLPLSGVTVDGRAVRFTLTATSGGGEFVGQLSADGKSITGDFVTSDQKYTIPFSVTRTGAPIPLSVIKQNGSFVALDVKIVSASYSATLNSEGTELTGTWNQGPASMALNFKRAAESKP